MMMEVMVTALVIVAVFIRNYLFIFLFDCFISCISSVGGGNRGCVGSCLAHHHHQQRHHHHHPHTTYT